MSIRQKALQFVLRPLLNERYRTGYAEGFADGQAKVQREWEAWVQRRLDEGVNWPVDDPPPGYTRQRWAQTLAAARRNRAETPAAV